MDFILSTKNEINNQQMNKGWCWRQSISGTQSHGIPTLWGHGLDQKVGQWYYWETNFKGTFKQLYVSHMVFALGPNTLVLVHVARERPPSLALLPNHTLGNSDLELCFWVSPFREHFLGLHSWGVKGAPWCYGKRLGSGAPRVFLNHSYGTLNLFPGCLWNK